MIVDPNCVVMDIVVGSINDTNNALFRRSEFQVALRKYNSWIHLYKERLGWSKNTLQECGLSEEQRQKLSTLFPGVEFKDASAATDDDGGPKPFYFVAESGFTACEHLRVVKSDDAGDLRKGLEPAKKVVRMLEESFSVTDPKNTAGGSEISITNAVLLHNYFMKKNPRYAIKCLNISLD